MSALPGDDGAARDLDGEGRRSRGSSCNISPTHLKGSPVAGCGLRRVASKNVAIETVSPFDGVLTFFGVDSKDGATAEGTYSS